MKILFLFLFIPLTVFASVESDMEAFFKSIGGGANYTKGGAYKTQTGGYYSGGSLYARVPTRSYEFMNFQGPSIKAGCGGIDIFAGSFSFVNAKQLVEAMRTIMNNAVGYSFNLALQTFVPQVYNTMQKINDIAREMNNFDINSCETSAQLLGSVWPRSDVASRQLCQAMGTTSKNVFSDWAGARHGCGTGGKREEITISEKDAFKDQLGDEFNLAWAAIKDQKLLGTDKVLAELFMSISGTIVGKKIGTGTDAKMKSIPYPSKINNIELLDMFLYGKGKEDTAKIYHCDENTKCLNVTDASFSISKDKALITKIEGMLRNMTDKMRTHSAELTANEKSLIELTQIPILKIIAVQNAFMVGNAALNVNEFSESIAYDYLLGYMEKILDFVSVNLAQLEKVQINSVHISEFKGNIADVRRIIAEKRFGAYQRMIAVMSVIEKSNLIEKKLQQMFVSYNKGA